MKLHLYARVSKEDANVNQMADEMVRWCGLRGYGVVSITKDKESGRIPLHRRRKFLDLLNRVPFSDADGLLVLALDRLTRNWYDENLIEKAFSDHWTRCKLVSVFDKIDLGTASGRSMFRFQMTMACYEVDRMFERQKIGIARAKKEGKYKGRKPGSRNLSKGRKH